MRRVIVSVLVIMGLLAAVVLGVTILKPSDGSGPSITASAPTCPSVPPVTIGTISVPAGPIAGYCQDKLVNAAQIMTAARSLGIGSHTQSIGVMTAIGESGLRVLAYGDAAGPDSRGLFQQRDNGAWGTLADRMDPYVSAGNFFKRLVSIPGWKALAPGDAAHAVQVNADRNFYDRYWSPAQSIVSALGG